MLFRLISKSLKENFINLDRIRICQCSVKQANTSERCHTQTNKPNSPQNNRNPTLGAAYWLKTSCTSKEKMFQKNQKNLRIASKCEQRLSSALEISKLSKIYINCEVSMS